MCFSVEQACLKNTVSDFPKEISQSIQNVTWTGSDSAKSDKA